MFGPFARFAGLLNQKVYKPKIEAAVAEIAVEYDDVGSTENVASSGVSYVLVENIYET